MIELLLFFIIANDLEISDPADSQIGVLNARILGFADVFDKATAETRLEFLLTLRVIISSSIYSISLH